LAFVIVPPCFRIDIRLLGRSDFLIGNFILAEEGVTKVAKISVLINNPTPGGSVALE